LSVGFPVGRVLGNLVLGFCIRVGIPLKCLDLFYLFFADKKKTVFFIANNKIKLIGAYETNPFTSERDYVSLQYQNQLKEPSNLGKEPQKTIGQIAQD